MSAVIAAVQPQEYLAFRLGTEEYGMEIQKVQELRGYEKVTALANGPAWIKGVINLRGVIVPIVDLRIHFALAEPAYDSMTVVIIARIGAQTLGLVVDGVSDVINLEPTEIKPAPNLGTAIDVDHLIGLASLEERMVILVDIEKLLASDELGLIQRLAA